jgi:hypothetical protein
VRKALLNKSPGCGFRTPRKCLTMIPQCGRKYSYALLIGARPLRILGTFPLPSPNPSILRGRFFSPPPTYLLLFLALPCFGLFQSNHGTLLPKPQIGLHGWLLMPFLSYRGSRPGLFSDLSAGEFCPLRIPLGKLGAAVSPTDKSRKGRRPPARHFFALVPLRSVPTPSGRVPSFRKRIRTHFHTQWAMRELGFDKN